MSTYKFKNLKTLNNYLNKKISIALDNVASITLEKLKENVNNSVYSWTPKQYERTYQLLNAISKTKPINNNGKYTVEIYFDPLKIQPILNPYGWNAHASFKGEWTANSTTSYTLISWL